jgi:hypothetical protein
MMTENERSELEARLQAWDGAEARPWAYHVSHSTLELELTLAGRRAILWCVAVERAEFSRWWSNAHLELKEMDTESRAPYVIEDKASGLIIRCGNARLEEDVK